MFKKSLLLVLISTSLFLLAGAIMADETDLDVDYPWRSHAEPFSFKFGNKIDSHQQSRIVDGGKLQGFLYIHDTGEGTTEGLPVAEPAKCPHMEDCRVGWILKGVPITATLVNKSPRVWLVDPADLPVEPGYNHFHWLGEPKTPHCLEIGQEYSGMLLKRIVPEPFFWLGGSGSGSDGGGEGHDSSDTGGCGGSSTGGCDSGSTADTGGCSGHDGSDTGSCDGGSTGGCDSGSTADTGGCSGHDSGDTGGCGGSDDMGETGGSGGHGGRSVPEGIDPHTNVVTIWDGSWTGGGGCEGHDSGDTGGCSGDSGDSGDCTGHDSGDTGSDPGGCSATDDGSCSG